MTYKMFSLLWYVSSGIMSQIDVSSETRQVLFRAINRYAVSRLLEGMDRISYETEPTSGLATADDLRVTEPAGGTIQTSLNVTCIVRPDLCMSRGEQSVLT
jgi:hypothetical protein